MASGKIRDVELREAVGDQGVRFVNGVVAWMREEVEANDRRRWGCRGTWCRCPEMVQPARTESGVVI